MEMIGAHVDLRTVLFDTSRVSCMTSSTNLFGPSNLIVVTVIIDEWCFSCKIDSAYASLHQILI